MSDIRAFAYNIRYSTRSILRIISMRTMMPPLILPPYDDAPMPLWRRADAAAPRHLSFITRCRAMSLPSLLPAPRAILCRALCAREPMRAARYVARRARYARCRRHDILSTPRMRAMPLKDGAARAERLFNALARHARYAPRQQRYHA